MIKNGGWVLRNISIGIIMVVTLKYAIINKSKSSVMRSLLKGQRLVELFQGRWKLMKEALCPSRWRRALPLKAARETEDCCFVIAVSTMCCVNFDLFFFIAGNVTNLCFKLNKQTRARLGRLCMKSLTFNQR